MVNNGCLIVLSREINVAEPERQVKCYIHTCICDGLFWGHQLTCKATRFNWPFQSFSIGLIGYNNKNIKPHIKVQSVFLFE